MIQLIPPGISTDDLKRLITDARLFQASPLFKMFCNGIKERHRLEVLSDYGVMLKTLACASANSKFPQGMWLEYIEGRFSTKIVLDDKRSGWNRYILFEQTDNFSEAYGIFTALTSIVMLNEPLDIV